MGENEKEDGEWEIRKNEVIKMRNKDDDWDMRESELQR